MADPYSPVAITGYNSNPPVDDGSQTEANRVKWSTIKTKITDPVKVRTDDMDSAIAAGFGKVIGGGGVTSTAISYQVVSGDQGKLVRASAAGITITTPDATDVGEPFVFAVLNDSSGDITIDGSGSQTIDSETSFTVPADGGLMVFSDGANWKSTGRNFQRTLVTPQGRLTPTTLTPVISAAVTSGANVYYTPYVGNLIPIYDGTNMITQEFAELTLGLHSTHAINTIYDVFVFLSSGAISIGTGPAWSSSAAGSGSRGSGAGTTQLARVKGLLTNAVSMTAQNGSGTYSVAANRGTYVGSIFIDGTAGQVTCHFAYGQSRKWAIWNAYNRIETMLKAGDGTATWTTGGSASGTLRAANANGANSITIFCGLPEEYVKATYVQKYTINTTAGTTQGVQSGIGVDSTTSPSGAAPYTNYTPISTTLQGQMENVARHTVAPFTGIKVLTALEGASASGPTSNGAETNCLLEATWRA